MQKLVRLFYALVCLCAVSCHTARTAASLPAKPDEYRTVAAANAFPAQPEATLVATAEPAAQAIQVALSSRYLPNNPLPPARPVVSVDSLATAILAEKPDPNTTAVNIVGAVTTAVGLGLLVGRAGSDPPQTEWGDLSYGMGFIAPISLLLVGICLLFFQGKNGRMRRLREARRQAAGKQ